MQKRVRVIVRVTDGKFSSFLFVPLNFSQIKEP